MTKLYVASDMKTDYPRKLGKPSLITPRIRDTAELFIMDSGIGDDVSNREVLDLADKYNADFVIAKDYLHDHKQTTESVAEFVSLHREHSTDSTPMLPLQPPYDEHYELMDARGLTSAFSHVVLGGMVGNTISNTDRINWVLDADEVIPDDCYVHGLGVGGSMEFVEAIAPRNILDSVDCATPERAAIEGSIIDQRLRRDSVMTFPGGEGRSNRTHALAEFNSWQIQDVWDREKRNGHQQRLADW